jgi:hypothetical protein
MEQEKTVLDAFEELKTTVLAGIEDEAQKDAFVAFLSFIAFSA